MAQKGCRNIAHSDDWINVVSNSMSKLGVAEGPYSSLDHYVDELGMQRASSSRHALPKIVNLLKVDVQQRFAKSKYFTLTRYCLNIIKQGSTTDINLACQAIGLLSISVGSEDACASHILEEIISPISEALKSISEPSNVSSLLECLAIATFMGTPNHEVTERSMQIIWQVANSNLDYSQKVDDEDEFSTTAHEVLRTAISSWSVLLTTMQVWDINSTLWKGSIAYISSLLEDDDRSVCTAVAEALALIFEIGRLDKFCDYGCQNIESLKEKNLSQVEKLSLQEDDLDEQYAVYSQSKLFEKVMGYLKHGLCHGISIKIGEGVLKISTWFQLIQVNFIKRILSNGFKRHMLNNETLHDLFDFEPKEIKTQPLLEEDNLRDREERSICYAYQPTIERKNRKYKRLTKSPNSFLNKARTSLRNKQRALSEASNADFR